MARNLKNTHYKTSWTLYNGTAQTLPTEAGPVSLGGSLTDTGCGAMLSAQNVAIECTGLYELDASAIVVATAAGVVSAALYMDGVLLPETLVQQTAAAGDAVTLVVPDTRRYIANCCNVAPRLQVYVWAEGGGTVNAVTFSGVKLA